MPPLGDYQAESNVGHQPGMMKLTVQEAFERNFNDFQQFAYTCLADVMIFNLPDLYIQIWLMLAKAHSNEERVKILRFAMALPRGFAKTTFIKLLVCWFIVYDKCNFVLVVCATEPLAHNFVSDVNDMLSEAVVEAIYGAWAANLAIDSKEMKKSSYRRRVVIIAAIGSGTSVRGLNLKHQRPDFIICDDMQTKENSDSDTESLRLLEWFIGTLLKAVNPFFAMVIYIGNMYVKNCILLKLKENKYWLSLVTGAILNDGTSLWEELHPIKALYESYKHDEALGMAHIWFAEIMNDPILDRISLLPDGKVPVSPFTLEELIPEAGFCIIDPAGFKKASDDNVIVFFLVHDSVPYAVKLIAGNLSPLEVIQQTVETCMLLNIRIIFCEGGAYQSTLQFWFAIELQRAGLLDHFIIQELLPGNRSKEGRIRVSIQQLLGIDKERRQIKPTWYIADVAMRQRYVFQAMQYKIGKPNNKDDILDAPAYLEDVQAEYWPLVYSVPMNAPSENRLSVVGETAPF